MKKSFTLAEVLITLAIIGVVSTMVIPNLIHKEQQKALITAKQVASIKFEEAMNQMRSNDKLTGYNTAEDFVNEFVKYMKTVQRCDSNSLLKCFTPKIKTATEEIETSTLKTGTSIAIETRKSNFPSNNVGLSFPSGIMAIVNYDKTCEWKNPLSGGGTGRQEAMGCLAMIYDVNGFKKPNKVGQDIILVNAQLSSCDGFELGNLCVDGSNTPIMPVNCSNPSSPNYSYCNPIPSGQPADFWAGAKAACAAKGMHLPSMAELGEMAKFTYNLSSAPGKQDNVNKNAEDYSLNIVNDTVSYWSSDQFNQNDAYIRRFASYGSNWYANPKANGSYVARCVK